MATTAYQGWAIWDSVAAVELLSKLDEPNRTTLQQQTGCQAQWAKLSDEGLFLKRQLVRLDDDPIVAGRRIGKQWAGGVAMPPQWSLRLANWTNAWRYFKTTDCVDEIGLYTAQSQGFAVQKTPVTPSPVKVTAVLFDWEPEPSATPAPPPDFALPPEDEPPLEPEGLSTGAKLGLAAGAIAVVGGLLWATTRKRR